VTEIDTSRREFAHRWPQFLPDGVHFIYFANSRRREDNAVYLAKLGSNDRIRLVSAFGNASWSQVRTGGILARKTDYLLFFREGSLLAQRIDTSRFQAVGEPFPIAGPIRYGASGTRADFSVSENGVLAYSSASGGAREQLVWRDRAGKDLGSVIAAPGPALFIHPTLSPDASVLATSILNPEGGYSIWLIDLKSGTPSRFTFEASRWPVWSADGKQIAFNLDR
jgi:Tol biopolymer transport system component